ncbi:Kinesin-like protein kif19 [Aphanomyces cochlioides]|nr:Kinesin-like protein kif19 [Aphanomyces cochlioides]
MQSGPANFRDAFALDPSATGSPKNQRSVYQSSPKNQRLAHLPSPQLSSLESPPAPRKDKHETAFPESHDIDDDNNETEEFKRAMWAGQANILVAVRLRPQLKHDRDRGEIVKVLGSNVVVVLDPGNQKDVVGKMRNRSREKRYAFDHVFGPSDGQVTVYTHTTKFLIHGILQGFNATVFAYGCTGAGKTYTMLGTPDEPGIMALTLEDLFEHIQAAQAKVPSLVTYRVSVSFLEVYNENIRDLLRTDPDQDTYLDLREDPVKGPIVADLSEIVASNADEVMRLLRRGNKNRSQEATAANSVSSRSHAVLQVSVEQTEATPDTVTVFKVRTSILRSQKLTVLVDR